MIEVYHGQKLFFQADGIASEAHRGPLLHGVRPYIFHPRAVAALTKEMGYGYEVQATAVLHDVLEDTDFTADDLRNRGIPEVVVQGILAVTWSPGEQIEKIEKARSHPLGHVVKFFDASHNLTTSLDAPFLLGEEKARNNVVRYATYLGELAVALPSPQKIREYLATN